MNVDSVKTLGFVKSQKKVKEALPDTFEINPFLLIHSSSLQVYFQDF